MKINYSDTLGEDFIFVDTRSPGEYEEDHVPGAINMPILDNEERKIVGTIYARDQEKAILEGTKLYEKKITEFQKQLKVLAKKRLVIYCFRGGMRSTTITGLAREIGLDAVQLNGGYKSYRKHIREKLHNFTLMPKLLVLHGLTGCGKTDLLQKYRDSIDLEGLAQHRSSVYGAISLKPRSQKYFETLLYHELLKQNSKKYLLIEGESRKIGNIIIPEFLFLHMKSGINIRLDSTMKDRVRRLVSIYTGNDEEIKETRKITLALSNKLGNRTVGDLISLLDSGNLDRFMRLLLEKYYDPLYKYSIEKLEYEMTITHDNFSQKLSSFCLE